MVSLALPQSAVKHWLGGRPLNNLPIIINLLLVLWLAWVAAGLSWLVLPDVEQASQPVAFVPTPITRQQTEFNEQELASWHLFGVAGQEKPVKTTPVDAPETRLKLTLRGVFASDEAGNARAIVGDPRGEELSYAVGDPLPGGAKLSEIYPDRIILERSGRFETLRLPKDLMNSSSSTISHRSATAVSATSSVNRAAAFKQYRNEIKKNPVSILNYVRATPARQAGKFVGFNIQPGAQADAMAQLGLQPGDIVTAINGMEIDSPAAGMQAMQTLGDGDTASVNLLRDGQELSLSLTLPESAE